MNRKVTAAAVLILVLGVFAARAEHIPSAPSGVTEFRGRTAVLLDLGRLDPLVELEGRLEDVDHELRYRSLTVGAYYRLHRNLKAGAFYRLQAGARHDDDWINLNPGWEWLDTRSRNEQVAMLDLSPRFLLPFLPGRDWVLDVKNRFMYNFFNAQASLLVRPGLTYLLLRNREPLLNFSFHYGLYIPLNFGETFLYEHEPYLSVLYHLNRNLKLELTGAFKAVTWSSSADSIANGDLYAVRYRSIVVGFALLVPLKL